VSSNIEKDQKSLKTRTLWCIPSIPTMLKRGLIQGVLKAKKGVGAHMNVRKVASMINSVIQEDLKLSNGKRVIALDSIWKIKPIEM
jgi:hypothetical protein